MERAEIFIAGRIDVRYGLVTTVMPGTTLYSVYQNKRKDYDVSGKLIYVIKHYEDFIYYELFDGYSGDIVMRDRPSDGSFCIVMLVPKDHPFDNGVSPYTVLMSVYKHFCDNYMEKITVDNSIVKRTFKANVQKNFWLDNYETLTKEIYGILAQNPLKKDFKITEYYPMNPSGKVCRLKIPENELKAFFLDSHSEYKDFSAIHFSTDYEGPCDNIPRDKKQEQGKTEKNNGSSLSETKNASSATNDKKIGSAIDMDNIQLKRTISEREETIDFCLDKISEIIDSQEKNNNQKGTESKPNDNKNNTESHNQEEEKKQKVTKPKPNGNKQEVESYFKTNFQAIADIISDKDETISKGKKFLVASLSVAAVLLIAVIMLAVNMGSSSGESVVSQQTEPEGGNYVKVMSCIKNGKSIGRSPKDTLKKWGLYDKDIELAMFYLEEYKKLPKDSTYSNSNLSESKVSVTYQKLSLSNYSWAELQRKRIEMEELFRKTGDAKLDSIEKSKLEIKTVDVLLKAFCAEGLSARITNSDPYKKLTDYEKLCMTVINKSGQFPEELKDTKALTSLAEKISQAKIVAVVNKRPTFEQFQYQVDNDYRKVWNNNLSTTDGAVRVILDTYSDTQYSVIEQNAFNLKKYIFTGVQDIKNKAYLINQLKEKDLL